MLCVIANLACFITIQSQRGTLKEIFARSAGTAETIAESEEMFKKHECEKCGSKFGKIEELMQHQQTAHERRLYMCSECHASFEGMEQMRDHAKKFHSYNKMKGKI